MSQTQFYNGRMIMDYSGKLAPVRMRIDSSQSEAASAALSNLCNILSLGKQIVETGEYTDYQIVTAFPDNSAINYNVYRLTLVDNIDPSNKEYMYIPSANLSLLNDNLDYIPDTSSTFTQIAGYVQPYYRSRLGNGCTLTAIEYVNQRNTIFPSQVGTATFAPQQVKTTNITENGQYIVNPDSGYIMGRNIINVNVASYPTQTKSVTYTENGDYTITPDTGYLLANASITVNVTSSKMYFNGVSYSSDSPTLINSSSFTKITSNITISPSGYAALWSFRLLPDFCIFSFIILQSRSYVIEATSEYPSYFHRITPSRLNGRGSLCFGTKILLTLVEDSGSDSIEAVSYLPYDTIAYSGTWW